MVKKKIFLPNPAMLHGRGAAPVSRGAGCPLRVTVAMVGPTPGSLVGLCAMVILAGKGGC